mgnify:CR=1 FL=1
MLCGRQGNVRRQYQGVCRGGACPPRVATLTPNPPNPQYPLTAAQNITGGISKIGDAYAPSFVRLPVRKGTKKIPDITIGDCLTN